MAIRALLCGSSTVADFYVQGADIFGQLPTWSWKCIGYYMEKPYR